MLKVVGLHDPVEHADDEDHEGEDPQETDSVKYKRVCVLVRGDENLTFYSQKFIFRKCLCIRVIHSLLIVTLKVKQVIRYNSTLSKVNRN